MAYTSQEYAKVLYIVVGPEHISFALLSPKLTLNLDQVSLSKTFARRKI
jgi:hypothetical protein